MAFTYQYQYPTRTPSEKIADGAAHSVGIVWAAAQLGTATTLPETLQATVLVLLFLGSAIYHLSPFDPLREYFRRFDHAMIFLTIPAIATPGALDAGLSTTLPLIWLCAVSAACLKLRIGYWHDWVSQSCYLALSTWAVLLLIPTQAASTLISASAILLVGLWIFNQTHVRFHMAVWHFCVVCGLAIVVS